MESKLRESKVAEWLDDQEGVNRVMLAILLSRFAVLKTISQCIEETRARTINFLGGVRC